MSKEQIHHLPERRRTTFEKDVRTDRLRKTVGTAALVAAGVLLAGTAAMVSISGCSSYESKPEMLSTDFETLHIDEGARIRTDAYVANEYDSDNLVATLDRSADITNTGDIEVKNTDGNGDWYSIPEEKFEQATGLDIKDKDGTVWVNQQKASPIDKSN